MSTHERILRGLCHGCGSDEQFDAILAYFEFFASQYLQPLNSATFQEADASEHSGLEETAAIELLKSRGYRVEKEEL